MPNPSLNPTGRFSSRVEFYLRSRPKYPAALLRFFRARLGLVPGDDMADVGCGTGFLSELFLGNGNVVYGVEPNKEMREAGAEYLRKFASFRSVNGSAEATTLPAAAVKYVTAGQAFHWFDPERARGEFGHILKPGGIVALIWNHRRTEESPFNRAYKQLMDDFQTEHRPVQAEAITAESSATLRAFFGAAGYQVEVFDNPQSLTLPGLRDRLASASYLPLPSHPRYPAMMRDAERLFAEYEKGSVVEMPHETKMYYGAITP